MIKIAVYGKGGIGKSTTVSNVAVPWPKKALLLCRLAVIQKQILRFLAHGETCARQYSICIMKKNGT